MATSLDERRKARYNKAATSAAVRAAEQGATNPGAVAKPSSRYLALEALRALPRALMGGTDSMRAAGVTYLPRHAAESDESYRMRLEGTTLYNGYEQTITAQTGKLFGKPVVLDDDVSPELETLAENIDGQGRALTPFAFDLMKEAMVDGISFIYVDMPQVVEGATMADQRLFGARPYWVILCASQIIGWRSENVNGSQQLTQLRIKEETVEPDGEFGDKVVQRIRVLRPGAWDLYEQRGSNANTSVWVLVQSGVSSLDYIPVVPVYTNRVSFFEGEPPLRTLAELNREHWQSSSEQRYALTFSRFAMLKVTGVDDSTKDVVIGPNKSLRLPAGADAAFIEHNGAGVGAGLEDLKAIESRMASAGMQLRVEQAGQVTATAAAIDSMETNAGLRAVAHGFQDALEQALQMTADYLGITNGGSVTVYDDFARAPPQGSVAELTTLSATGKISLPTLWDELKRRHVLADDFDPEVEMERLLIEQAMSMPEPAPPPPEGASPNEPPPPEEPVDGAANPKATEDEEGEL